MKKWIHNGEDDWRTDTSNPMINAFREVMAESLDLQDDSYVGIFWYDVNKQELFGVKAVEAHNCPFHQSKLFDKRVKTCDSLHEAVWKRYHYSKKDHRYAGKYTLTPRGRVFYVEDEGFIVVTGDWIDKHPEAKEEIIIEFNLPEDSTFIKDEHWNIGHGDSANFI